MAKSAFNFDHHVLPGAPARIELLGDKTRRPEKAGHIISFPGGAIELTRTTSGLYWAHILVNGRGIVPDAKGFSAATGRVVDGRIDRAGGVSDLERPGEISQVAVLIATGDER